jgi:hypothetical protein
VHLRHFFRGLLKKEEVASAFLATLLEQDPAFRKAFFQKLFPDAAVALASARWTVQVEVDRVDIRLDSDAAVVIIENKVKAGAYERGQVLRYYESELARVPAEKPIFVAFVAPDGVGTHETDYLGMMDTFRKNDSAASVSWQTLAAISDSLKQEKTWRWFVESGFNEIERIIDEDSRRPVYPREGTRALLVRIADEASQKLQSLSPVKLGRWSGRDHEQIFTNKTHVTLWLDLAFDAEDESPYLPVNVQEGDCLKVFLKTQFKLSGAGRKVPKIKSWWTQRVAEDVFYVPGIGEHRLNEGGWFVRSVETVLPADDLTDAMVQAGLAVLDALSRHLGDLGFSLSTAVSSEVR